MEVCFAGVAIVSRLRECVVTRGRVARSQRHSSPTARLPRFAGPRVAPRIARDLAKAPSRPSARA